MQIDQMDGTINVEVHFILPFTDPRDPGTGNNAAVVIVGDQPISRQTMGYIASKLAQPETIFAKKRAPQGDCAVWEVRWYTAGGNPINPGGNSTVALAHYLAFGPEFDKERIIIKSEFPYLDCSAERLIDGRVSVSLPSVPPTYIEPTQELLRAFNFLPTHYYVGQRDVIALCASMQDVLDFRPNFEQLAASPYVAFTLAAPSGPVSFGYRTFIAQGGEASEDLGSGGSLMNLAPLLQSQLQHPGTLIADQVSDLGGIAWCAVEGDHVVVSAYCSHLSGPNQFTFPIMGGELSCTSESCTDAFVWV
jgi:predicted PhzF superfamily epimerase YddE/YHI9